MPSELPQDAAAPSELDVYWMREALRWAAHAAALGEVPVGAVFVDHTWGADGDALRIRGPAPGLVLSHGFNLREAEQDPTAHAEHIALQRAAARRGSWRLSGVTCYVTLEPCPMCAGALVNGRVDRVVYGARDPKAGAMETLYSIGGDARLNHRIEVVPGVLEEACGAILSGFFQEIRERRRAEKSARQAEASPS
jgi:tRNA(adenine34) deaminase